MEAPARIELATLRLGNECSIHLSYGAMSVRPVVTKLAKTHDQPQVITSRNR
jgi:hypothetical protein